MFSKVFTRLQNFYLDPSLHSVGDWERPGERQVKIDKKDMTDRDVSTIVPEMFHAGRKLRNIPTLSGKTLANCHLLPQKM